MRCRFESCPCFEVKQRLNELKRHGGTSERLTKIPYRLSGGMVDAGRKVESKRPEYPYIQVRFLSQSQQLLDVKYVQQQTLEKFGFSRMLSLFHAEKELSTYREEMFLTSTKVKGSSAVRTTGQETKMRALVQFQLLDQNKQGSRKLNRVGKNIQ